MLRVHGLHKRFGKDVAVDDVNFEVKPGERLALVGPTGCGKTTILRLINRMIEPDQGQVELRCPGVPPDDAVGLRRRIGYVAQGGGLFPHWTVRDNILIVPRLLGWTSERCNERLYLLTAFLWLFRDWFDRYPHELSGGQRQRVELARALAGEPVLLLLDEPFAALDSVTRMNLRHEFLQMPLLAQITVVLVTHDPLEAVEFGDRLCVLNEGRIEQVGTATDVLFSPASDFVRRFFAPQRQTLEWEAVELARLALPESLDWREVRSQLGRMRATIADAVAAWQDDPERTAKLLKAFADFKASRARPDTAGEA